MFLKYIKNSVHFAKRARMILTSCPEGTICQAAVFRRIFSLFPKPPQFV